MPQIGMDHEGSVRIFNGVSRRSASNALKPYRETLRISGNNPPGPPDRKDAGRKWDADPRNHKKMEVGVVLSKYVRNS